MATPTNFQRGKVIRLEVTVRYPDGTMKTTQIRDTSRIAGIAFHPALILPRDQALFNKSASDWRQNPTMIVYRGIAVDSLGNLDAKDLCGTPYCGCWSCNE